MWQMWPGAIAPEHINEIINEAEKYPLADPGMGYDGSTPNNDYRNSEIRWMSSTIEQPIVSTISYFSKTANRNGFGFDIDYINDIQFTTYRAEQNGKYDWHEDIFWDCARPYHRKVSFILQLTDPSEYEGGEIQLDPNLPQPDPQLLKLKGTVLVFPSFVKHRVTPVTAGTRQSLVSWVEGPKFR